jgi:LSD1 subclass zinc finger protein
VSTPAHADRVAASPDPDFAPASPTNPKEGSITMPINLPTGATVRTVTFWYPADFLGITDWGTTLTLLFDDDLRPEQRMPALPTCRRARTLLAAPTGADPIRCAGGPLHLLDIAATGALAAREAEARHDRWSATARVGTRRPGRLESALLRAGRHSYVTYHSLRRVVGDALVTMRTGGWLYPAAASPQALLDHVAQATARLADAAPDDVLVTVRA